MSVDEAANVRIMKQLELVERIRHENEVLKMDLTHEARAGKSSIQVNEVFVRFFTTDLLF